MTINGRYGRASREGLNGDLLEGRMLRNLADDYTRDGYVVLPGLLDPEEINLFGNLVNQEIDRGTLGPRVGRKGRGEGYYTSDASKNPNLQQIGKVLLAKSKLHQVLSKIFGCKGQPDETSECYRRLPRNDLMVDCASAPKWHQDMLHKSMSEYIAVPHFATDDAGESLYHIINVGFYFEDHSTDGAGLWVVPGSHRQRDVDETKLDDQKIIIYSKVGDVIVWDWRTYHKGGYECVDSSTSTAEKHKHRSLFAASLGLNNVLSEVMARGLEIKYQTETLNLDHMSQSGCNGTLEKKSWRECLVRHVKDELKLRPLSQEQQQVVDFARSENSGTKVVNKKSVNE